MRTAKHEPGRDRDIFKVMQALAGMTAPEIARATAKLGNAVSSTSIYNWRRPVKDGGVRYPMHMKLNAAAAVAGLTFALVSVVDQASIEARYNEVRADKNNVVPLRRGRKAA